MKIILFLMLTLLFISVLNAEWIDIETNRGEELFSHNSSGKEYTEIKFSLDGYNIETISEKETSFDKISYWKDSNSLEVGKPDLPKITKLISIPNEGTVSFEIINTEEEVLRNITVYPTQELQSESDNKPFKFVIDEDYYDNGSVFPAKIVEIGEPVIMRDQRVVSVSINPFQYNAQDKTLRIITNIDIVVNASGRGGINPKTHDKKTSRFFEPLYRSSILNYDSVTERNGEYQDASYLFIYPDNATLLTNLEYLTDWKHQKGFNVTLASTADTGTNQTLIKNYIQNAYDTWENPPEFVCLVGDVGGSYSIPTFTETWSGYGGEGDHPYAQLDGDDVLEDIFIGRISISSITNLQTYVAKVLNYEKEPYMDETDWYDKSLMVGDPSSSGPSTVFTNQTIVEMMQYHAPNIVAEEVYSSPYSSTMSTNLNLGVSYFNYRGYIGMSGFSETQINVLTNTKKLPFAVILTCSTGSFASGTCRSEAFIRAGSAGNPTGAIASIGTATSGTHTNFNNCMDAGIYYGIFADGIYNPGGAVNRGKLALYEHYPQNQGNYVDIFSHWNTLMGDPGVELWTGIPQELIADYETDISLGTTHLEVTVTDDSGTPLKNAWVTALMGDDEIFSTGFTDESGYVSLEINASLEGAANLTITKHNFIPHLGGFDVGEVDRFVNVLDVIIDDSAGNNDSMINPGEDIGLQVSLNNFGTQTANSVTATIITDNAFVTITDDTEDFGSIASGSSAYCTDDFDISIDADVLGGTEIRLDIAIEDNAGNSWNDMIFLVVEGSNLDAVEYTITDANGYLDPGETVEMNVTLQNNGLVTANAVYGEFISPDSRITVLDADGYFDNITGEGGQSINTSDTFEVTAGVQLIVGTQIMMELHLYNADGYDSTVHFLLGIGEVSITDPVGPDAYGYFCYDDEDIHYISAPTYDWIEINGIGTNLNLYDPGDDGDSETITNLPITFRMYGEEYDTATVCSNGWIAPGGSTQASFMNSPIPGPQGPSPMIAPFWDDLKTGSGDVYWYYDSSLHTVIIEWDHMQSDQTSSEETFQVILYDANYYPTITGDSEIKFQYKVINNTSSGSYPSQHGQFATVGIEDYTGTVGSEYTFNNTYPVTAKPLQNEMAILMTTSPIPSDEPFLVLGEITIIDENSNGQADYGEDISLEIVLTNLGENLATNVSATISSADNYITINQAVSIYDDIQGGVNGNNQTYFEVTVAENCPDGHSASFEMNIISDENSWISHFSIELNAPVLEFHSIFVDDGDNNILDPDETTDVYISFMNTGGSDATNILTEFFESDPYITLNTSTYTLASINAGGVSTCMFNVTASAFAPLSHTTIINWEMNGDINYNATGSFSVLIALVPILIEEDFSGTFPPDGWTLVGQNTSNWSQSISNNAGGSTPESRFFYLPLFVGVSSLVSPVIDTSGSTELNFQFRHYLNDYNGSDYSISVRTTSDGGNTWNTFWEINPIGDVGPELIDLSISTSDVGSQNFQFALVFDGISMNLDYWDIDNIHLESEQGAFINGNVVLEGGIGDVEDVMISAGEFVTSPNFSGDYFLLLSNGTYDIIVGHEGYETETEYNVQVYPNETVTIDFELTYLQSPENLTASVNSNDVLLEWEMAAMRIAGTQKDKTYKNASESRIEYEDSNTTQRTMRSLTGFKVYRNNIMIAQFHNISQTSYSDQDLESGEYSYYVTALYDDNNESIASNEVTVDLTNAEDLHLPVNTVLIGNYPNPFNPDTKIEFSLLDAGNVELEIYNIKGQKVRTLINTELVSGFHSVVWDGNSDSGKSVTSGVYFYRMQSAGYTKIRKMVLMK